MKRLKKVLKWGAIGVVLILGFAQLVRPAKTNPKTDESQHLFAQTAMNSQVAAILDRSCRDCHSNQTRWPWYSHVAPVSWFVIDHVNHGRSHLNFSEWARYNKEEVRNQLRNMCREARAGAMPLQSYLLMHWNAELSDEDIRMLCDWTTAERER